MFKLAWIVAALALCSATSATATVETGVLPPGESIIYSPYGSIADGTTYSVSFESSAPLDLTVSNLMFYTDFNYIYYNDDGTIAAQDDQQDTPFVPLSIDTPNLLVGRFTTPAPMSYYYPDGHISEYDFYLNDAFDADVTVTDTANYVFSISAVPEPATWTLMLAALGGLGAVVRRRRRLNRVREALGYWRPGRESNSGARICSPLRNHSATRPKGGTP